MIILIIINSIFNSAHSETHGVLILRAIVSPSVSSNIEEIPLNSSQSLWRITNKTNSAITTEGQKFEIEGPDQKSLDMRVTKIITNDHKIQIDILLDSLPLTASNNRPIVLKITAN